MRPLNAMERKWAYSFRPVSHRAAVVVAGPLINIVFGALLISGFLYSRDLMPPAAVIAKVEAGSPAAQAGLMPLDRIISINGADVDNAVMLAQKLRDAAGVDAVLGVIRGESATTVTLSGYSIDETGSVLADIGVETTGYVWTVANPLPALTNGIERTWGFIDANAIGLVEIASGSSAADGSRRPDQHCRSQRRYRDRVRILRALSC